MAVATRSSALGILLALVCGGNLIAQESDQMSVIVDLRDREYAQVKKFTIAVAEMMPAHAYAFKPLPTVPTFGQELAHIAMTNSRLCRGLTTGVLEVDPEYAKLDQEISKERIVQAVRRTFELCDAAFRELTEETARLVISTRSGRRGPRGGLLTTVVAHTNEEYGKLAMFLRLKGLVPPSSDPTSK